MHRAEQRHDHAQIQPVQRVNIVDQPRQDIAGLAQAEPAGAAMRETLRRTRCGCG